MEDSTDRTSDALHHAEAFCEGIPNRWGWQCLICGDEAYTATLALAEAGVARHEAEASGDRRATS